MFDRYQFEDLIVRVLRETNLPRKRSAIDLLLGTAAQESAFGTYLRQTRGPALGVFQMEPATFICTREFAHARFPLVLEDRNPRELEWDLYLAIVSARINYLSKPGSIPDDIQGQAEYWKKYWNTSLGKGTVEQYMKNWRRYCA